MMEREVRYDDFTLLRIQRALPTGYYPVLDEVVPGGKVFLIKCMRGVQTTRIMPRHIGIGYIRATRECNEIDVEGVVASIIAVDRLTRGGV